jgi:hypothetical protein
MAAAAPSGAGRGRCEVAGHWEKRSERKARIRETKVKDKQAPHQVIVAKEHTLGPGLQSFLPKYSGFVDEIFAVITDQTTEVFDNSDMLGIVF